MNFLFFCLRNFRFPLPLNFDVSYFAYSLFLFCSPADSSVSESEVFCSSFCRFCCVLSDTFDSKSVFFVSSTITPNRIAMAQSEDITSLTTGAFIFSPSVCKISTTAPAIPTQNDLVLSLFFIEVHSVLTIVRHPQISSKLVHKL